MQRRALDSPTSVSVVAGCTNSMTYAATAITVVPLSTRAADFNTCRIVASLPMSSLIGWPAVPLWQGNRPLKYMRTCDLDHAARPRNDSESKAMQLHNRGHQIQAKTQA
jgi:hypothetical protein